ncbi:TonB-dependent receptor [Hirschia litorea]|uniref:TonB-dependent receptor n=1 Tax=Hirschia litorea TaxID=1199156 RepID=A0ABW2INV0_9PROT
MLKTLAVSSVSLLALNLGVASTACAQVDTTSTQNETVDKAENVDTNRRLDSIVVTAQKTEQTLQEVPVALSVIGADAVNNAFASSNLESLTTLVPSVSFRKGSTNANSAITIRGIGTISFSDAAEPSVATVVDGVVLGRSGQAFGDLFDIERIEVLRGPQGTLFGKNASAGVVNIVTSGPNKDELAGYVSASYFQDQEYQVKARLTGPINDNVAASLTLSKSGFDGYIRNLYNNQDVNGYDRFGGRFQLAFEPSDDFSGLFTYEHAESDDDCCADIPALNANAARFANSQAAPGGAGLVANGSGRPVADIQLDTRVIDQDFETRTTNSFDAFSLTLNKDAFGGHTLTSISSFRSWENSEFREGDFTSSEGYADEPVNFGDVNFLLHDNGTRDNSQFSQELRIQSPTDSPVNYQVGAYYFNLQIESDFTRLASCQNNGGQNQAILDANPGLTCNANDLVSGTNFANVEFDNLALFGQADYDIIPGLNVVLGGRYTQDDVSFINSRINNDPFGRQGVGVRPHLPNGQFNFASGGYSNPARDVPTGETDNLGNPILVDVPAFQGDASETNFSVKAGINSDLGVLFRSDHNLGNAYFVYSQGYKGPAFNVFFNQGTNDTAPIGAEESDHYEIGYKIALSNVALNLAVYNTDITGFQANAFDNSTGVTITRLTNAGDVRTRGVELDGSWAVNDYLTLNGSVALNEAEIVRFNSPINPTTGEPDFPGGIFSGQDLLFSPDLNYSFGADFEMPLTATSKFYLNTTFSHVDEQESFLPGGNPDPTINPYPIGAEGLLPDYNLLDMSFGVEFNDNYRVTFIAKNLLDESFVTTNSGDTFRYQIPREADRYFGVNFRAAF